MESLEQDRRELVFPLPVLSGTEQGPDSVGTPAAPGPCRVPAVLPEAEEPKTCRQGHCVRGHPVHCCHFPVTVRERCARKGYALSGWRCVDCGEESSVWTMVKV